VSASGPDAERHAARLQELSRPGGPLGPDTTYASTHNPAWYFANGRPRAGRRRLHDQLLQQWREARLDVAGERQALLLAGPPGAGKSTAQNNLSDTLGVSVERWRVINSDDFKDRLLEAALADGSIDRLTPPEVRELYQQGERFWPRELAAIVHDEAGQLVSRATAESIANGENLIVDGTLSDLEKARQLTDHLRQAGYTVRIASVDGPQDVTKQRASHRWRNDYLAAEEGIADGRAADLGGRWVPSEVPSGLYQRPDESRCATVARELAASHPAIIDHYAYRVERPDGAPQPTTHTGRTRSGATQLSGEELATARLTQAARGGRARRPQRGR
jgi:predicted ABC-type ATPase